MTSPFNRFALDILVPRPNISGCHVDNASVRTGFSCTANPATPNSCFLTNCTLTDGHPFVFNERTRRPVRNANLKETADEVKRTGGSYGCCARHPVRRQSAVARPDYPEAAFALDILVHRQNVGGSTPATHARDGGTIHEDL